MTLSAARDEAVERYFDMVIERGRGNDSPEDVFRAGYAAAEAASVAPRYQIVRDADGNERVRQIECENCAASAARIEALAVSFERLTWGPYVNPGVAVRALLAELADEVKP